MEPLVTSVAGLSSLELWVESDAALHWESSWTHKMVVEALPIVAYMAMGCACVLSSQFIHTTVELVASPARIIITDFVSSMYDPST